MADKIFKMLDLFYANKHLYEKIKKKKEKEKNLTNNVKCGTITIGKEW